MCSKCHEQPDCVCKHYWVQRKGDDSELLHESCRAAAVDDVLTAIEDPTTKRHQEATDFPVPKTELVVTPRSSETFKTAAAASQVTCSSQRRAIQTAEDPCPNELCFLLPKPNANLPALAVGDQPAILVRIFEDTAWLLKCEKKKYDCADFKSKETVDLINYDQILTLTADRNKKNAYLIPARQLAVLAKHPRARVYDFLLHPIREPKRYVLVKPRDPPARGTPVLVCRRLENGHGWRRYFSEKYHTKFWPKLKKPDEFYPACDVLAEDQGTELFQFWATESARGGIDIPKEVLHNQSLRAQCQFDNGKYIKLAKRDLGNTTFP